MNAKIAQNASGTLVTSLRLWIGVDFPSNSVYAEPVQVRLPCIPIPPHKSVTQLGNCQYYSMFNEAVQALLIVFLQAFKSVKQVWQTGQTRFDFGYPIIGGKDLPAPITLCVCRVPQSDPDP